MYDRDWSHQAQSFCHLCGRSTPSLRCSHGHRETRGKAWEPVTPFIKNKLCLSLMVLNRRNVDLGQNRRERDFPWQIICNLWIGADPAPIPTSLWALKCDQLIKEPELEAILPWGSTEQEQRWNPPGFLLSISCPGAAYILTRGYMFTPRRHFLSCRS